MKRIISVFLQTVGGLSIIGVAIVLLMKLSGSSENDYKITNTIKSPSGKHYASTYTRMGGGAAGWCRSGVVVYPIDSLQKDDGGLIERWSVIDGRCSEEFFIEWKSSKELTIVSNETKVPSGISIHVSK